MDELRLVEKIDVSAHKRSQRGRGFGDGVAVTGNIRKQEAIDPAGGAAGSIIDVTAEIGISKRLAVNPGVESAEVNAACDDLASAPDFHALHVLGVVVGHGGIVGARAGSGESEFEI